MCCSIQSQGDWKLCVENPYFLLGRTNKEAIPTSPVSSLESTRTAQHLPLSQTEEDTFNLILCQSSQPSMGAQSIFNLVARARLRRSGDSVASACRALSGSKRGLSHQGPALDLARAPKIACLGITPPRRPATPTLLSLSVAAVPSYRRRWYSREAKCCFSTSTFPPTKAVFQFLRRPSPIPSTSTILTLRANMSSTTAATTVAEPITAETILRLFPDIDTRSDALEGHDEEQIRLMDEVCIVTDENDLPIGTASKKLCK